ncbi:MAG TPA: trigger factor [Syntrophomonadaceae bacterium]|nr:trigger factor [Syntrophomonadaceae bacterium]
MQAKLEKIENSEAYIQIEVGVDRMEEGFEYAYRKIAKDVNIPGFRKGRAPRQLVESFYGKEILYQDALEHVVPNVYEEAIKSLDIEPIAQPEFDIGEIEDDKPLTFTAIVAVKPDVVLGELEGLNVSIPIYTITDEDVDKAIEQERSSYAQLEKKDGEAVLGDTLIIDFEGFLEDVAFEGGKGEDYPLELGSNTFIPGFEEKLVGVKTGDVLDVDITFPEEYHEENLAGKPVVFKVTVKEIEGKVLRELDDEFVQEISEFETVAEYREDIEIKLNEMLEKQKEEFVRQVIVDEALKVSEVPAPQAVVRSQAEAMLQNFAQKMAMQGLNLEQYYMATGSNEEEFIQNILPDAEHNVKINFMLEKLVDEKGFEITDEELDTKIEEIAMSMGVDVEDAKTRLAGAEDNIRFDVQVDKVIDYLIEKANIIEEEPELVPTAVEPTE